MMIYGYIPKSKTKKLTKAQKEQKEAFDRALNQLSNKQYSRNPTNSTKKSQILVKKETIFRRETPKYESVDTGFIPCTKPIEGNVYTGEKMRGVATMHKSNAVPVFNDTQAKEISSMRR